MREGLERARNGEQGNPAAHCPVRDSRGAGVFYPIAVSAVSADEKAFGDGGCSGAGAAGNDSPGRTVLFLEDVFDRVIAVCRRQILECEILRSCTCNVVGTIDNGLTLGGHASAAAVDVEVGTGRIGIARGQYGCCKESQAGILEHVKILLVLAMILKF